MALVVVATLLTGGAFAVACSSGSGDDNGGTDGGKDSTTDGKVGSDTGPAPDGGPGPDGGPPGTCEAGVTGACDIIAQNCGPGKDCDAVQDDAGNFVTQCVQNTIGAVTEGACCTGQAQNGTCPKFTGNTNPCTAGLECIEDRCAKHCCLGDDSACGKSNPEGFPGRCNLTVTLVDNGPPAYAVCAYSAACEPFQIQPCTPGQACFVNDSQGTSTCTKLDSADAGEGQTCKFENDCSKDGMGCYGTADGGSTCQWTCYVPPGPFDAGVAQQGAGAGGCPTGEKCQPINWGGQLPTWLGLCGK
ncbi:MAG TPA: hypothetical protein VGH28_26020 [Polyangiaceae bacterium]